MLFLDESGKSHLITDIFRLASGFGMPHGVQRDYNNLVSCWCIRPYVSERLKKKM